RHGGRPAGTPGMAGMGPRVGVAGLLSRDDRAGAPRRALTAPAGVPALDGDTRPSDARAGAVPHALGARTRMIDRFIEELHTNSCVVHGPMDAAAARGVIVDRARAAGPTVAYNDDVAVPALGPALRDAGLDVFTADEGAWSTRIARADVGITGARIAVADPAAIGLVAAPGSPRATSLVPHTHVCVLRVAAVVPTLAE